MGEHALPAFIAVEAAPQLFCETILPQRERFRELAARDSSFTCLGTDLIDTLARCILFEADAHMDVHGQQAVPVVWLDEHRDAETKDQGVCTSLGRNYYFWFKGYLAAKPPANIDEAFRRIHKGIAAPSKNPLTPRDLYRRDAEWAELILQRVQRSSGVDYAIVVIGVDHIASHHLSVLSVLEKTVDCRPMDITGI